MIEGDHIVNFQSGYFRELASLEKGHFWFEARNSIIVEYFKKYVRDPGIILEIGCGTGFVASTLAETFPMSSLFGVEAMFEGLQFACSRSGRVHWIQADAFSLPFSREFDAVGLFDVLEHIDDDAAILHEAGRVLNSQGCLVLTVPQHPWLWNYFDDASCHVRRYSSKDLINKVEKAGFQVLETASFFSLILPLLMLRKLGLAKSRKSEIDSLRISPWINNVLRGVMAVETSLLRAGLRFPCGGSLFLIARKAS